jgi:hypothetical protein
VHGGLSVSTALPSHWSHWEHQAVLARPALKESFFDAFTQEHASISSHLFEVHTTRTAFASSLFRSGYFRCTALSSLLAFFRPCFPLPLLLSRSPLCLSLMNLTSAAPTTFRVASPTVWPYHHDTCADATSIIDPRTAAAASLPAPPPLPPLALSFAWFPPAL